MGVNHPLSFVNLFLAFINMQTALSTSILHMRKYPSLKNCYKYLLKSAIQKLAGQIHHCKSQKKERGGIKAPNKTKTKKYKQKEKKKFDKVRNGPQKIRK